MSKFRFREVTKEQVINEAKEMDDKQSMGLDNISYGVVK